VDLVLLLLAIALVGGVAAVALGSVRGGLDPPTSSLPTVSLPAGPLRPGDVDDVRFSLGLRGYRMQQVDAVLDRLRAELAARDVQLAEREQELAALREAGLVPGPPSPPAESLPAESLPAESLPAESPPAESPPAGGLPVGSPDGVPARGVL
jgi:DivIVA domain-containing protein